MHQIHMELGKNSYPIYIDADNLNKFGDVLKRHLPLRRIALITNETIEDLYGGIVQDSLLSAGIQVKTVVVPDGEEYKSLEWAGRLFDSFVDFKITRHSGVVSLGGGVIGDLAGFAAATFMRGIAFVQIPTSLIAQVDSSVGGKTAVNHPKGKNLIGAFHQPKFVFIDVSVLKSLPEREFRSGLVEVIKHGVIMDEGLFEYIEDNVDKIMDIDMQSMEQLVSRSCKDKAIIVEQDEKEQNIRAILNYGHTVGHSIEAVSGYNQYRHGEAISIGMAVAARIAVNMGILDETQEKRQNLLLSKYGLPVKFPDLSTDEIIDTLYLDKKIKENKKLRFIFAKRIGKAIVVEDVAEGYIRKAIDECR